MLYGEIIAVCSETHTKYINTMCGQNVGFLSVKPGNAYSNQWALTRLNFQSHENLFHDSVARLVFVLHI